MDNTGWKKVSEQFLTYPFIGPLHFTERRDLLIPENSLQPFNELGAYLETNRLKYLQFIRHKSRYPTVDIYACFQPFNESFKALYNFVPYLKSMLAPGDIILNLWDRSGWTAAMLAGWFPEQQVWTMWEGDKDILGYKGFDYWMSPDRRKGHTILFGDFEKPLPIASQTISAVVGFDLLHRFHQADLLREIHRVCRPSAPVLFPHVHLTNNFPDPFFERGCRQLHGNDYASMFAELQPLTGRAGYILSEPAAFHNSDTGTKHIELESTPSHTDYNGCIAWLDPDTKPYLLPWRGHQHNWEKDYLLQNPFLSINPLAKKIEWNRKLYGGQIDELMDRHQVYKQRITPSIGQSIDQAEEEVLYWAAEGKTLEQIRSVTGVTTKRFDEILNHCWQLDLAQAIPVDEAGFRLQTLLGRQHYLPEEHEQHLQQFWRQAVAFHGANAWIKTSSEVLSYAQGDELIDLTKKALQGEGMKKGHKLLICTNLHTETLIMFWAAVTLGIIVVPVSTKESIASIQFHWDRFKPDMAFVDPSMFAAVSSVAGNMKVVMTDKPNEVEYNAEISFEALLSAHADDDYVARDVPNRSDIAVILSTTGSTGNPKSIPLTHWQVIRSGKLITETYQWKKTDRYFGLGGLETMSGLRHATVAVAEVGAACVPCEQGKAIHQYLLDIKNEGVTILTANPLFYKQLLFAAKSAADHSLPPVRLALCTGNVLPAALRKEWKERIGTTLYNYYGLTETSGICIAEVPGEEVFDEKSIGRPIGCLIKTIDESGKPTPVGEIGELSIYGAGNFSGYYDNEAATSQALAKGWFYTKDLAVINADGTVSLHGRMTDLIKLPSGERVDIAAIEEVLSAMELIKDWAVCPVREFEKESTAIFFVAESHLTVEDTVELIKRVIAERIGQYAVPRIIAAVESIPRGNHNKVIRAALTSKFMPV